MSPTFTEETQPEAIRRAQDGDAAAFEYLYKANGKRVYSLCLRMLKNTSDAEDLTQQIFLRLFRKIGAFRGDACFSTWLHRRVAVNAVLMHLRRKRPDEIHANRSNPDGANVDASQECGVSDISMLGAIERLNLARHWQVTRRLQTAFLAARRYGLPAQRNCEARWMLDWLLKVAGAQGPETTATPAAWRTTASKARTGPNRRHRCCGHRNWTEKARGRHVSIDLQRVASTWASGLAAARRDFSRGGELP